MRTCCWATRRKRLHRVLLRQGRSCLGMGGLAMPSMARALCTGAAFSSEIRTHLYLWRCPFQLFNQQYVVGHSGHECHRCDVQVAGLSGDVIDKWHITAVMPPGNNRSADNDT